jgi:hypothetical protein
VNIVNTRQLETALETLGWPAHRVSLDGTPRDGAYILETRKHVTHTLWTVYAHQNGRRENERHFASLNDACQDILERVQTVMRLKRDLEHQKHSYPNR